MRNRTTGLNLDIPSQQHIPRSFIEWLSCPRHFMYMISGKFHDYPTCMHHFICFIQIQKLGASQRFPLTQGKAIQQPSSFKNLVWLQSMWSFLYAKFPLIKQYHPPPLERTFYIYYLLKSSQFPVRSVLSLLF